MSCVYAIVVNRQGVTNEGLFPSRVSRNSGTGLWGVVLLTAKVREGVIS